MQGKEKQRQNKSQNQQTLKGKGEAGREPGRRKDIHRMEKHRERRRRVRKSSKIADTEKIRKQK